MARLEWTAAAALAALAVSFGDASAADVKEINFVEAVHNLGYINLYVGQHAGIFEKNGVEAEAFGGGRRHAGLRGGARQERALRHRRCDHGSDVARGRRTRHRGRHGRAARALFRRVEEPCRS